MGAKCAAGEGGLAGAGDADERDEATSSGMSSTVTTSSSAGREHGHLGRGADLGVVVADAARSPPCSRSRRRPRAPRPRTRRGSTRTGGRGGAACRRSGPRSATLYSTFGVVTIDRAGPGVAEHGRGHRGQPRRVDVLDDLHEHGGVEADQPVVACRSAPTATAGPGPAGARAAGPAAAAARPARSTCGETSTPDDLGVAPAPSQVGQQGARAAAEVEHPGGAGLGQRGQHGLASLLGQRDPLRGRRQLRLLVGGGRRLDVDAVRRRRRRRPRRGAPAAASRQGRAARPRWWAR